MTGVLLVDKPVGLTSHDVVDKIRKAAGMRRVGHTGTLDPNATGLLILCLGAATRLSEHLTGLDKTYEGVMRLGQVTDTLDRDGEIVEEHPVPGLTVDGIQEACNRYLGEIEQVPPMVSAVKLGGERLYKKARKGETVERKARTVKVQEFTVLGYDPPEVQVRVRCSSGTYVRSLVHDVGRDLGCGAMLASLRRTWVGRHAVDNALPLSAFDNPDEDPKEIIQRNLLPMGEALDLPEVTIRPSSVRTVSTGGTLSRRDLREPCSVREGWIQIKNDRGKLLALGTVEGSALGAVIQPKRVFTEQTTS